MTDFPLTDNSSTRVSVFYLCSFVSRGGSDPSESVICLENGQSKTIFHKYSNHPPLQQLQLSDF